VEINHLYGDLLKSKVPIILHQVNYKGAMNSGIAKQIREAFPEVYSSYKYYCQVQIDLLGRAFATIIDPKHKSNIQVVINIFSQEDYGYDNKCYTDYKALEKALYQVKQYSFPQIALPYKMGCCRGGGDWDKVYSIIEKVFKDTDTEIFIYELDKG